MSANEMVVEQVVTGWLLILSGLVFATGGTLYTGRAIWKWPAGSTPNPWLHYGAPLLIGISLLLKGYELKDSGKKCVHP